MAHIPKDLCSGPWFQTIGVGAPSGYWLLPEETLLMMSSGRLELLDEDGLEMTLLGSWAACIEPAGGVNKYLVLKSLCISDIRSTLIYAALATPCFDLAPLKARPGREPN